MWSRAELKYRAKEVLRGIYWKAFLVSLVIAFATGSGGGSGRGSNNNGTFHNINPRLLLTVILGAMGVVLFFLAIRIFLGYPLEVGGRRFFIKSARYEDNTKCFSYAFWSENYRHIIPTMLLRGIYIFLWTLLLIIPGIVASYAYSMVPYILAEQPNIGAKEALRISNQMTRGHKLDMFILDLSFFGWYLLGALALGIGTLFVLPYDYATKAELYLVLSGSNMDY